MRWYSSTVPGAALSLTALMLVTGAAAAAGGSGGGDLADEFSREFQQVGLLPRQARQLLQDNIQPFDKKLGGFAASSITQSDDSKRPFTVDGDTFTDFQSAADRACDNQKNKCADQANSDKNAGFKVNDCDKQNEACKKAASSATTTSFAELTSSTADFDIFCET